MPRPLACPCGQASYQDCCGRFIEAERVAGSAREVMQARYSAYVLGRYDFVRASWHPDTCPADLERADGEATKWLGLEIRRTRLIDALLAEVEFVARYRVLGRGHRLHELSRFERVQGHWLYRDGQVVK